MIALTPPRVSVLFVRMLRVRVAVTIWAFMAIGAAAHGFRLTVELALVMAALGASYVAATTVNDIADRDLDRVNHPDDAGRPLVRGSATERDLWHTNVVAACFALGFAAMVGFQALVIILLALGIGYTYSLRPLRLSYRTWLAPSALSVAYVVVPYSLGALAMGARIGGQDGTLLAALFALFMGRINLKDLRDREGDARFGKPTLLLRFGKGSACAVSLVSVVLGGGLLVVALGPASIPAVGCFMAAVLSMLYTLRFTEDPRGEQAAIGLGAKMGNGLLATTLAWLLLSGEGAPVGMHVVFSLYLVGLYAVAYFRLAGRPQDAVIAYKG